MSTTYVNIKGPLGHLMMFLAISQPIPLIIGAVNHPGSINDPFLIWGLSYFWSGYVSVFIGEAILVGCIVMGMIGNQFIIESKREKEIRRSRR